MSNPANRAPLPPPVDAFELPGEPEPAAPAAAEPVEPAAPRRSWREEFQDVDWRVVRSLLFREALLTLRSRAWTRLLAWFAFGTCLLALLPILYRMAPGHWHRPSNHGWLVVWAAGTGAGLLSAVSGWTRRRIARELRAGALEEIVLTGSGPADILLGKSLATAGMAGMLVLVTFPPLLFAAAVGGRNLDTVLRLALTLGCCAYLGLCIGLEYSFRRPGTRSTLGRMWSWYYLLLLVGNVGRFVNWSFLSLPRQWMARYNPVSTLLNAAGLRPERWPVGMVVFGVLLVVLTLVNFRLLRREWSQAVDRLTLGSWFQRLFRPKRTRKADAGAVTEPTPDVVNPLVALETRHGHRVRIEKLAWIVGGTLLFLLLAFVPNAPVVRGVYGTLLWLTCLVAGHNGCAPLVRERERGGWEELALLPLTDGELAAGKLWPGVRTVLGLSLAALAALVASYLRAPAGIGWLLWGGVSLLLLPASFTALGALAGLLSPTTEEAHWRVGLLSTALPAVLLTGMLFGLQVSGAELLSPLFGALSAAGSGSIRAVAWAGTLVYAALGAMAAGLLRRRFREWALGAAIG